jgi:3-oxoacyl-[acyl-carrier protein] reductase
VNGRLGGQVALVIGGGRGVGRAIGEALAAAGGGVARGWTADVTDLGAVAEVVEEVEAALGPVTLLVNNAGTAQEPGPLWEADPDGWWRDLEVHVRGAFHCCRAVLPGMVARRRGRVVNIGSMVGARDEPYVSAYACAKAAYFRLTGTLAGETAGHGVTVLCVSPGLVRTRMVEESLLGEPGRRWRPQIAAIPAEEYTPRTTWTSCWPDAGRMVAEDLLTLRLRERPED